MAGRRNGFFLNFNDDENLKTSQQTEFFTLSSFVAILSITTNNNTCSFSSQKTTLRYLFCTWNTMPSNTTAGAATSTQIESALATLQPLRDLARNFDVDISSW